MNLNYKTICFGFGQGESSTTAMEALDKLDKEIEIGIINDWSPLGGISIALNQIVGIVAQAMVKENK